MRPEHVFPFSEDVPSYPLCNAPLPGRILAFLEVRVLPITIHIVAPFQLPWVDAVDCFEHVLIAAHRPAPIRRYFEVAGGAICNISTVSERRGLRPSPA